MQHTHRMNDFDKLVRCSALKLVAVGVAIGFLLGFVVGSVATYYSIERTVIIPLSEGIRP